MIELKKDFSKRGTSFHQLYKDDKVVVYSVSRSFIDGGGESVWYEVFRRITFSPNIYHSEEFEKYPGDEQFGKWAWSCSNLKSVEKVLLNHFDDCDVDVVMAQITFPYSRRAQNSIKVDNV